MSASDAAIAAAGAAAPTALVAYVINVHATDNEHLSTQLPGISYLASDGVNKGFQVRAPSRSRKPLRLTYDSLRLASRLKPASRSFYGGGVSYGGLRRIGE